MVCKTWRSGDFRKPQIERTDEYYIKLGMRTDAVAKVNRGIKNGFIVKSGKCQICGSGTRISGHHHNGYNNPYDLWWLCHRCNMVLPFHDGVLSLEEASIYVKNRTLYNSVYKAIYENKMYEAILMIYDSYIDLELARIKESEESRLAKNIIIEYDQRCKSNVIVLSARVLMGYSEPPFMRISDIGFVNSKRDIESLKKSVQFVGDRVSGDVVVFSYTKSGTVATPVVGVDFMKYLLDSRF